MRAARPKTHYEVTTNWDEHPADDAPVTWNQQNNGQTSKPESPITKEQFIEVVKGQVSKWKARALRIGEDENLISAEHAYQLLSDQAQLLADLAARISIK